MKWIFVNCVYALMLCQVLAVPASRFSNEEDSIEQELIRNHHSAALARLKSRVTQAPSDADESSPIESIEEVADSEDDADRSVTEDDLYDITVGDVIRDVLLTLRDHPEIVKELIASEKAKLAEQIDAFNNLVDSDSAGDSLAGFMKPAEQLNSVPKSVEKKNGRSGMAVMPGQTNEIKRADELLNDEYTPDAHTAESQQYKEFMHKPMEGGQNDPMFNYENDLSNRFHEISAEDFASNSEVDEEKMELESNQENKQGEDSVRSGSSKSQEADTESNGDGDTGDIKTEAELAWLLKKNRARQSAETSRSEAGGSDINYNKM